MDFLDMSSIDSQSSDTASKAEPVFESACILNVTNFYAKGPGDPLGYLGGDKISLYPDGSLVTSQEHFHVREISGCWGNVENYNPCFEKDVKIMLREKSIQISFAKFEEKQAFMMEMRRAVTAL